VYTHAVSSRNLITLLIYIYTIPTTLPYSNNNNSVITRNIYSRYSELPWVVRSKQGRVCERERENNKLLMNIND